MGGYDVEKTPERWVRRFDSWGDFVEEASAPVPRGFSGEAASNKPNTRFDGGWYGDTKDHAEAVVRAAEGYQGVRRQITELTDNIKDDLRPMLVPSFGTVYDVAGGAVDIARFVEGEPECMMDLTPIKVAKPGRVVSLLVNGVASSMVQAQQIIEKGAAITALVETLDLLQHGVEVWVEVPLDAHRSVGGGFYGTVRKLSYLIKVKGADDRLDVDQMAFALCHPAFLRRLVFRLMENMNADERQEFRVPGAYGKCAKLSLAESVNATISIETISHYEDPEEWVRNHLSTFGLLAEN